MVLCLGLLILTSCLSQVSTTIRSDKQVKPKNIILMIGDGMGLSHVSAHLYQQQGSVLENIKHIGFMKTQAADDLITDSAAGATAMVTGQKTFVQGLGLDAKGKPIRNLAEIAHDKGFLTGVVTTSGILNATPASLYGHCTNRYINDTLVEQFLNTKLDFVSGGDKKYFDGQEDGRNLIPLLELNGFMVSTFEDQAINEIPLRKNKRHIYFSSDEDPILSFLGLKHLSYAAATAIRYFNKSKEKNYFLMIEGAQIDWACHNGRPEAFFDRMESFELAIKKVLSLAEKDKETLVIITADHATGGVAVNPGSKEGDVKIAFTTNGHTG